MPEMSRRTVAAGAWAVPVIAAAAAAPARAASQAPRMFTMLLSGRTAGFGSGILTLTLIGEDLPPAPELTVLKPDYTAFNVQAFSGSRTEPQAEVLVSGWANETASITAYGVNREFVIPQSGNVTAIAPTPSVSSLSMAGDVSAEGHVDGIITVTGAGLPARFLPNFWVENFGGSIDSDPLLSPNSVSATGAFRIRYLNPQSTPFSVLALGWRRDYMFGLPGPLVPSGEMYPFEL